MRTELFGRRGVPYLWGTTVYIQVYMQLEKLIWRLEVKSDILKEPPS